MNRRFFWQLGAAAILVAAVAGSSVMWLRQSRTPEPDLTITLSATAPFALVGTDGRPVTDQTYRGKIVLVYFGYTLCPDVCPTTLNNIAATLAALGSDAAKVQALFVTVDPHRDTPKVLADYVKAFDARIVGLSGTDEQIAAAAKRFGVYYRRYSSADFPDGYAMDHSAATYVMNPRGRLVALFTPDMSPEQMTARLENLIGADSS